MGCVDEGGERTVIDATYFISTVCSQRFRSFRIDSKTRRGDLMAMIKPGSRRQRCAVLFGFILMSSLLAAAPDPDAGRSSVDMSALADRIAGYLKRRGRDSVAIGPFTSSP